MSAVFLQDYVATKDVGKVHREVSDRFSPVFELAKGRRVLNIGCTGSDALVNTKTVHHQIAQVASHCVGIDIYAAGIEKMRTDGENVFHADAERFELDDKDFDLVIMGDVIEHVSNPGLILDNANRHLKTGGLLLVTTPNLFALPLMVQVARRGSYFVNSEHVYWFDPALLARLMQRSGFTVEETLWTGRADRWLLRIFQRNRLDLLHTFGLIARKTASIQQPQAIQQITTRA